MVFTTASQGTHGVSVISSKSAMVGGGEGREDGEGESERRVLLPRHRHVPGNIRGGRQESSRFGSNT